ncbi:carbon-nitrogen family hydrolase [Ornithinimicrobium sp. INDO-MA30-4]|uniref:carbon-nitrogen family hydrolase n=1 Tax=Ornithinimicrobium sp. INDO-MA30-4 TaxID=2908651 RepID=UPI001F288A5F|nr:carbon-nitrogen family hydrolase [Ornithinimicrobium sp. INDO-MA30-4]UJH69793.1 carbon-nitrogen family hydrolase [Ornithinimicrobium sp. INDO-MA30-4]
MRICVIQLGYGDDESVAQRTERVAGLVRANADHDLVVLPELWSAGGFDYRSWGEREQQVDGEVTQALAEVARDTGVVLHTGSVVEHHPTETGVEGRGIWNTSVVLGPDGEIEATYRKIHRFGFGEGEPALMEAGADVVVTDLPAPMDELTVGLSTCYDLRFPELYRVQVDLGAQMFVIPAAWPLARVEAWRTLLRARAIENQAFVVACNTAGTHAGTTMGGHSAIIDPQGEVLAEAGTDEEVLSVQIDPDDVDAWRERFPVLTDRQL